MENILHKEPTFIVDTKKDKAITPVKVVQVTRTHRVAKRSNKFTFATFIKISFKGLVKELKLSFQLSIAILILLLAFVLEMYLLG